MLSFFHLLGIDVDSNIYVRSLVVLCLDILSTSTVGVPGEEVLGRKVDFFVFGIWSLYLGSSETNLRDL